MHVGGGNNFLIMLENNNSEFEIDLKKTPKMAVNVDLMFEITFHSRYLIKNQFSLVNCNRNSNILILSREKNLLF